MIDVLVIPWVFEARVEHGMRNGERIGTFAPVIIAGRLTPEGTLQPHESSPWIPRDRLQPVEHGQATVGELSVADEFATRQPFAARTWRESLDYARKLVPAVAGCAVEELEDEEYLLRNRGVIMVAEAASGPAIVGHILKLYDSVREQAARPEGVPVSALRGLLRHAGDLARPPRMLRPTGRAVFERSARHWATASAVHPLAPTQRAALHALLDTQEGEVLAVQGPPGTGKTTLLKSVVAQLWVEAALEGRDCPIIAACSTNNQAVTNVIDAYAKEEADPHDLWQRRWLPDVGGLGLYAASENPDGKDAGKRAKYPLLTMDGAFVAHRDLAWIKRAGIQFLEEASGALGSSAGALTVKTARDALRGRMAGYRAKIAALFERWEAMIAALGAMRPEESVMVVAEKRTEALRQSLQAARESEQKAQARVAVVAGCAKAWDERLANEPWWQVFFAWWAPVRARRDAGRRRALEPFATALGDWPDVEISAVASRLAALRHETGEVAAVCAAAVGRAQRKWLDWTACLQGVTRLVEELHEAASDDQRRRLAEALIEVWRADGGGVEALADVVWRERAFRTAMHYWEAGYLLEMELVMGSGHKRGDDPAKIWERGLRRAAMLAPCLAATFFMLPKFFRSPAPGPNKPLWGVIDLLVGDESGQVPPEKAVASFALARRAFVVGDVFQIEPVWSVPGAVDAANAATSGLIPRGRSQMDWSAGERQAVSASAGNLMALAQQASVLSDGESDCGGLLLREHRRCVPELVGFCNEGVYRGQLLPLRRSVPKEKRILPPFGYARLPYRAEPRRGGRSNPAEARMIVAWLQRQRGDIEAHYKKPLRELVAVVTPFRAQKAALLRELAKRFGPDHGVTAGTVHALQGAEIPIVLFSPVYDETHRGTFFFNGRGSGGSAGDPRKAFQMLNVAVSRAQDTFLIFGCLDAFDPGRRETPAGKLGEHLFGEHGTEIVDLPWDRT